MSEKRELTRAEQVRARRALRTSQETPPTSQRPAKPVTHVTSRVGTTYVQTKHKRVENNNRRFNIALGLPHITLHKPVSGVRQSRGSWRFASFLLAIMFGTMIYFAWTLPYFHVPVATVLGNNRLSREEINAVLGVTGESIFLIQPKEVVTRLRLNYPELASVEVNVYLPNYVYVTVNERQPVIVWQQGDGFTWIDATGVAFRPHGQAGGLITVFGLAVPPAGVPTSNDPLSPPSFMQKELVDAILVLAPNVPAGSTLTYDPNDGLGWKDDRGWKVFFGTNTQNMALKLRVYQSLVDSLAGLGKVPEYINVAYPDAPYYRMSEVTGIDPSVGTGQ
jgi:hypothetical protein